MNNNSRGSHNNRRVVTNRLASSRPAPYGRQKLSASASRLQAQRLRTQEEELLSRLVSKLKGLLTPSSWRSPNSTPNSNNNNNINNNSSNNSHTITNNATPSAQIEPDVTPSNAAQMSTPTHAQSPNTSQSRFNDISLLDSNPDSPNHKLMEFFLKKGSESLNEVERQGVLALIKQAADRNESLIDISPSALQRRLFDVDTPSKNQSSPVHQRTVNQLPANQRTVDQRAVNQRTVNQRTPNQRAVNQRTANQLSSNQRTVNQSPLSHLTSLSWSQSPNHFGRTSTPKQQLSATSSDSSMKVHDGFGTTANNSLNSSNRSDANMANSSSTGNKSIGNTRGNNMTVKSSASSSTPASTRRYEANPPIDTSSPFQRQGSVFSAPKYTPLYTEYKNTEPRFTVKRTHPTPQQLFELATPYRPKFAQPTAASLAKTQNANGAGPSTPKSKPKSPESKPISSALRIINAVLEESKDKRGFEKEFIEGPFVESPLKRAYGISSSSSSSPSNTKSPRATASQDSPHKLGSPSVKTTTNGFLSSSSSSSLSSSSSSSSPSAKKDALSHLPQRTKRLVETHQKPQSQSQSPAHPYLPNKGSSLRNALTASPAKASPVKEVRTAQNESQSSSQLPFNFPGNTESAKKAAPTVSPSKPLFGESPIATTKQQQPHQQATQLRPFQFKPPVQSEIDSAKDSDKEANGSKMSLDSIGIGAGAGSESRESTVDVSMNMVNSTTSSVANDSKNGSESDSDNDSALAELKNGFLSRFTLPEAPSKEDLADIDDADMALLLQYQQEFLEKFQ